MPKEAFSYQVALTGLQINFVPKWPRLFEDENKQTNEQKQDVAPRFLESQICLIAWQFSQNNDSSNFIALNHFSEAISRVISFLLRKEKATSLGYQKITLKLQKLQKPGSRDSAPTVHFPISPRGESLVIPMDKAGTFDQYYVFSMIPSIIS